MPGTVITVRIKPERGQTVERDEIMLQAGKGIEGDYYFENDPTGKRQVLLIDRITLTESGCSPGDLREQILLDYDGLQSVHIGSVLKIGNSQIEITMDCTPCRHMAETLGEDPNSFVERMMHKRGMLGRVVASGIVRQGDKVELLSRE